MAHLKDNQELLKRVKRIAGQVQAIEKALVSGKDCETTLHLVSAVRGAMSGLLEEILEEHLKEHVAKPGLTAKQRADGAKQLMGALKRYGK